ncbi:hypothetical protein H0W32_02160 [Patescibacteria group bacterium]|nr:hypothetical protein [Patescibacteria group bacterium]
MIQSYLNLKEIQKIVGLTLLLSILATLIYFGAEPQLTTAVAATDSVIITLTVDPGITITSPADASMSRNLGVSVNTAIATTIWNVKTNNSLGYTLAVKSTSTPAMRHANGTDMINNYTEAVATTPETWSVSSGSAEFGYSAFGTDVPTGTWGTDTDCIAAAHVPSAGLKYVDMLTTDRTIATRASTTTPTGVDATVCYAVEQNGFYIPSGTYTATITATATTL